MGMIGMTKTNRHAPATGSPGCGLRWGQTLAALQFLLDVLGQLAQLWQGQLVEVGYHVFTTRSSGIHFFVQFGMQLVGSAAQPCVIAGQCQ